MQAPLLEAVVPSLDGVLLTGGGDIDPARYGLVAEPETANVDSARDASELALVKSAMERRLPILAICRGAQLLNVALGGTLIQDLKDEVGDTHRQPFHRYRAVHRVDLQSGSVLAERCGATRIEVNSIHHQAIGEVASSLRPVGVAKDGVIEALESSDQRALAVQWHPECLSEDEVSAALFSWLIDAADQPRT
jgi:putative glutamine amidotransferase